MACVDNEGHCTRLHHFQNILPSSKTEECVFYAKIKGPAP